MLTSKVSAGTRTESVHEPVAHASRLQETGMGSQSFSPYTPEGTLTYGLVESQEAFVQVCDLVLGWRVCPEGQPQTPPRGHELSVSRRVLQRGTVLPTQSDCICSSGWNLKEEVWGRSVALAAGCSHVCRRSGSARKWSSAVELRSCSCWGLRVTMWLAPSCVYSDHLVKLTLLSFF